MNAKRKLNVRTIEHYFVEFDKNDEDIYIVHDMKEQFVHLIRRYKGRDIKLLGFIGFDTFYSLPKIFVNEIEGRRYYKLDRNKMRYYKLKS